MRPLFTREALTENFTRVRAEERPAPASSGVFAVFEDSERKEDFLGLVTPTQIARYPWRIFADLLPTEAAPTVSGQTTLESTLASMESASVDALAVVDQKGRFAGVVTLVSLTRLLLAHARSSVSEIPREEEQLRAVMRALPDVALPDLRARVRAASRPPAPRPIVVVESEVLVADDIRSSLLRFGYDVPQIATSASEALTAVEAHHPALVIIDVRLDGGTADGIAAAAAIRTRYPTPIVFLIAYSDDAMLMRAQAEAPPHGYVLKPYQDFELQAAVEVALYRHALEQETRQQHALMAGVLSGMADAVAAADANGRIVLVNDAGRRAFGPAVSGADAERNDSIPEVRLLDRETPFPAEELPLSRALAGEVVRDVELFVRSANQPDGRFYSVDATPLFDAQGMVCGAVEVGRDVTEIRTARSKLEQELETDALTGVYNRRGFMDLASTTYQRARQSGHEPAVFFIDLNCMKEINDSLGHAEGDRLLIDVAWILRGCFRTSDIIGRLGGDEFVVLAPEAQEHADVLRERLLAAVDQFNVGSERAYRVSISIGLSQCVPGESPSLEELVEQADRRMYEDKLMRSALRVNDTRWSGPTVTRYRALPPPPISTPRPLSVSRLTTPSLATLLPPAAIGSREDTRPRKRVLLVDDEPRNLTLLEAMLAPLGHELIRVEDGHSALKAFALCKPDLVLLDLAMPGIDGLEVLTAMRSRSGSEHIPIIILTAHSEREHKLRGLEAGADDFLEKPADGRSLRVRVSTLLQLKESRDLLRKANDTLEERNAELRALQHEQQELTAFIVHDLKTPLAIVWGNLSHIRDRLRAEHADIEEAVEDARQACRRLRAMIDDLLVVSRLEEADFPLKRDLIVLSDLLLDVLSGFTRQAADRRVDLLPAPMTTARFEADRALLQRVIENIIDNSLRYTPEQGKMGIATRTEGAVEIAISNTGPPIPPSERTRIFEKFARIEPTTQRGHAGLGLYFCKRAVEALGGQISVVETPEWPTSFVLRLPG